MDNIYIITIIRYNYDIFIRMWLIFLTLIRMITVCIISINIYHSVMRNEWVFRHRFNEPLNLNYSLLKKF